MHKKNSFNIKTVCIYTHEKPAKEKQERGFIKKLIEYLQKKGVLQLFGDDRSVYLSEEKLKKADDTLPYDLKIAIGGDGTILRVIRTVQKNDGLILGVNFGTLGFLSEFTPDNFFTEIEKVMTGKFMVDERMMIKSFLWRKNDKGVYEKVHRGYALNELTLGHGAQARIASYSVKVHQRKLSVYRADGLIFATPTGSTAYSLSAGGPIVAPQLEAIIITPVAPHVLSHRPIVMPTDRAFNVEFESRASNIVLTIDGQQTVDLRGDDRLTILKSTRKARFVRMGQAHFLKTLRKKMGWGETK